MSRMLLLLAATSSLFGAAFCEGFFTIVGSKVIRPDTEYHLSITSQGFDAPSVLSVSINGTEENSRVFLKSQDVTLDQDETKMITFDLKNLMPGNYKLNAKSLSGITFDRSVNLDLNLKKFSTFIQTDKAIYKPGDKIQFRVLVLDANTKPYDTTKIAVHINDGGQNRIKQFSNVKLEKGVYQDELQLSDSPVLGNWNVIVEVEGKETTKQFEVAEYVLPKYEVTVDSPAHVAFKDGKIRATVRAKYTYGKMVKGTATVSAFPVLWHGGIQPFIQDNIVRKVVKVDGKGTVEFDIKDELKIEGEYERNVQIEAIFEEELTGRRQNGSTKITLHKFNYKMELIKDGDKYKPGLPYNVFVKVSNHDGSPVVDKTNPVKLTTSWTYDDKNDSMQEVFLDENGMGKVAIDVPGNTTYMSVRAIYLESDFYLGSISKAKSNSNNYIMAKVNTESPQINKEVSVTITATEEMNKVTFQVLGRGDVIVSKTLNLQNQKTYTFKFFASFAMVPKASLVVYYIRPDGELVNDRVEIDMGDELQNFLKLELSTLQAKPGQDLKITINTKPNSYVGLLGVDQSVLLLKSGNDIEKKSVFEELENFNTRNYYHGWYGGYFPTYENFESSGAIMLTNAKEEPRTEIMYSIANAAAGPAPVPLEAFAGGILYKGDHEEPVIRTNFPETWIYDNFDDVGYEGQTSITKKVPDTITSWIITGFSIDPITGLGLTKVPRKLNVFQPFFVSTNLPYSIKRGEVVAIPITVFNYMDVDQQAEVTLVNPDNEFEFAELSNDVNGNGRRRRATDTFRMKTTTIKANSGSSLSFMVRPLKVGFITIKVTATTPIAGDGVERQLLVEPEGVTQFFNKAIFVDLRDKNSFEQDINITIPKNAVPDSTKIEASAVGDILGPTIKNLDQLIRMPYGCGEQNMLNFVPNIVVLDYLTNLNQLTPEIEGKAKRFMESGYQRELTYKHDDGSYSAFGKSDTSGSTWLTAFVAKSFREAAKYILVDDAIITEALDWLSAKQASNGSFPEVGKVSHKDMQGGSAKGIALTAYTLITFLENPTKIQKYQNTINKALDYIVRNEADLQDNYSMAIAAYALQLAKHSAKDLMLSKLDSKSENKDGKKYWEKETAKSDESNPWNDQPNSVNVEMSAYAMQAFMLANLDSDAVPIMKWLVAQRNDKGGFQGTQDTVVGLQSLAKMAAKIHVPNSDVNVVLKYNEGTETKINVNKDNALVLQKYDLPSSTREINVKATGNGFNIVQLSYKYNMNVTGVWPRFVLDPQVNRNSNQDFLHLTICTSFVPDTLTDKSNMAVMEVSFPSGFTHDSDTLPFLKSTENVKRVETKDGDTVVIVYFDDLDKKEICPTFKAYRTHKVAMQKPAPVVIYDYYDNSRRATSFYKLRKDQQATLCDICEGADCGEQCKIQAAQQVSGDEVKSSSVALSSPMSLILIAMIWKFYNMM